MVRKRNGKSASRNSTGPPPQGVRRKSKRKSMGPRAGRSGLRGGINSIHAVCALTDPFCVASVGSRIPDGNTAPTFPVHIDGYYVISSNASGEAYAVITPDLVYNVLASTIAAGSSTTAAAWQQVNAGVATFVSNNTSRTRCVNFGCEIIPTLSPMNASGFYILAEETMAQKVSNAETFPNVSNPTSYMGAMNAGSSSWVSRPTDPTRQFVSVRAAASDSDTQWSSLMISILGAPVSTPCMTVRITGNFECEFLRGNAAGMAARPNPTNTSLLSVSDRTREILSPYIKGGREAVEQSVARAAASAIRTVGSLALNYMTGGASGVVGSGLRIMDM